MTTAVASQRERVEPAPIRRRTVNQTLCAATHVSEGLADYVLRILDGRPQGDAPSITEDPVAVVRHAAASRRLRLGREVGCSLVAVVVICSVIGRLSHPLGFRPAVAAVALFIAVCAARKRLARGLRAMGVWAWRSNRDRGRSGPLRWVASLTCATMLAIVLVLSQAALWDCALMVLVGLATGGVVVIAESAMAHRRAAAIVAEGSSEPRDLAPPVHRRLEQRIEGLTSANVVVYSEERASAPFVGNGLVVRPWKLDIDVRRRPSDAPDDTFETFDVVAFHEWLEGQFLVETAVESTTSRQLMAGHRIYVDGRKLAWNSPLVADGRPLPHVEWEKLAEELRHPERADDQRVYFYLQEICRDGEIGVCTFVRPLLQGGSLSIEFVPLVITPVHPDVEALVIDLPLGLRDQIGRAIRLWTFRIPAAVFGSPIRCARRLFDWGARQSARAHWLLAVRCRWFYDLGAVMSIREGVSWRTPEELDHFVIRDLIRINDQLRDRLVTSIKTYLQAHGIDPDQMETAVTINQIQNWNVGNVRADMVGFGNNNTFGNPGRGEG
ncbi:hypothetical protein AB0C29_23280 [Actinoplanes sp. NPDC048791]|uniref:hypothetical protein n=1 Tax=Actinoplanes sp. NPDC048791 TaxID=3154623 RepID=UPI0033EF9DFE